MCEHILDLQGGGGKRGYCTVVHSSVMQSFALSPGGRFMVAHRVGVAEIAMEVMCYF